MQKRISIRCPYCNHPHVVKTNRRITVHGPVINRCQGSNLRVTVEMMVQYATEGATEE